MSDLRQKLRNLSPAQIAALARKLDGAKTPAEPTSSITQGLTGMRRRLWSAQRVSRGASGLNSSIALDVDGALDVPRLRRALIAVIARHHILRATYSDDGSISTLLPASEAVDFEFANMSDLDEPARSLACDSLLSSAAAIPFDLSTGPLIRVLVVSLGVDCHRLGFVIHHIAFDAWSRGILLTELAAAYADEQLLALSVPAIGYAEYIADRASKTDPGQVARLREFWRVQVEALPASPLDGLATTGLRRTYDSRLVPIALPNDLWAKVTAVAMARQTTPFALAVAALAHVLHRLSAQQDIALITSFAGREDVASRGVVGPLIDTLLIRANVGQVSTREELVDMFGAALHNALAHRGLPFEEMIELSGRPVEEGTFPLSSIAIVMDQAPVLAMDFPGLAMRPRQLHSGSSQFDVMLLLENDGTSMKASLEYRTDLIDASAAHALSQAFVSVLSGIASAPQMPLCTLGLTDASQAAELLSAAAGSSSVSPPLPPDIGRVFLDVAKRFPEKTALRIAQVETTYAELLSHAYRVTRHLQALGVGSGTLVAIALPRNRDLFAAMLGVALAGATFLIVDVAVSASVASDLIAEAAPAVLLTCAHIGGTFGIAPWTFCVNIESLDADSGTGDPYIALAHTELGGNRAAYRIYTSGSTGKPKGIDVSHRSLVQLVQWQREYFQLKPGDVVSQFSTPSFDAIIGECCMSLLSGATLVVVDDADRTPERFARFLVEEAVCVAVVVPSFLSRMDSLAVPVERSRWLVVVGEAFATPLAALWLPRRRVVNAYGPAEFTVYASAYEVSERDLSRSHGLLPIGKARDDTRAYVLDHELSPVPYGIPGELYLAGEGVALGYSAAPAATASRFQPDPFIGRPGLVIELILPQALAAMEALENQAPQVRQQITTELHHSWGAEDIARHCEGLDQGLINRTQAIWECLASQEERHGFARYLMEGEHNLICARGLEPQVLEHLLGGSLSGLRGVDLGAGGGEVLDALQACGAEVIGVDMSPWLVDRSRRRGHRVAQAMIDSALDELASAMEVEAASLDFSLATLVLDRVASPKRLLENLIGLLKPKGRFALQVLLPNVPFDEVLQDNAYTATTERIVEGADAQAQHAALVSHLATLGAVGMVTYRVPYTIVTSEGRERMQLWSITGTRSMQTGGQRMYRTGDRVVLLESGDLVFKGRTDRQLKVRGGRLHPAQVESILQSHPAVDHAIVAQRLPTGSDTPLLVAWCVCRDADVIADPAARIEDIRDLLTQHLAHWAIPQRIELVSCLPLGPGGKPDESKLQLTDRVSTAALAPRDSIELTLLEACRAVLGEGMRGIDDSVFDAGADSISLLRISARLQEQGLSLDMRDYFECRSVRLLAKRVTQAQVAQLAWGSALPSPIQAWAMSQTEQAPAWMTQWCVLALAGDTPICQVEQVLAQLVESHDALRSVVSYQRVQVQRVVQTPVRVLSAASREEALALAAQSINPSTGQMVAAAWVAGEPAELVLMISHFAIDAVSWTILQADLCAAFEQRSVRPPVLSHIDALRGLAAYAAQAACLAETDFWLTQIKGAPISPKGVVDSLATRVLDQETTRALLTVAAKLSSSPLAVLHACVARLLSREQGVSRTWVDIESNGRNVPGLDLSRTVGWFTALYPVVVCLNEGQDCVEDVRASVAALNQVPGAGVSFQLLGTHHEDLDVRARLSNWNAPVVLNYLGAIAGHVQFDGAIRQLCDFGGTVPPAGTVAPYPTAVDAWINQDGCLELQVQCTAHSLVGTAPAAIDALVNEIVQVNRSLLSTLPFKLGLIAQDSVSLEGILAATAGRDVSDVVPLNAMQSGMMFHVQAAPDTAVYENQMRFRLRGAFEPERWRRAWQAVVSTESTLRTSFINAESAWVRAVHRQVETDVEIHDVRNALPTPVAATSSVALAEQLRSFQLDCAPLARMTVVRLEDQCWEVIWTFHHLIVDGWSVAILIERLLKAYVEGTDGPMTLLPATIMDLPETEGSRYGARTFWTAQMQGALPCDPLGLGPVGNPGELSREHLEVFRQIDAQTCARIGAMARQAGVTLACYLQAAWAMVLGKRSGQREIIFGLTVSGRDGLPHAENATGLFVRTVPVRVNVSGDVNGPTLLQTIQQTMLARRPFERTPLGDIQRWAGVFSPGSLFNHVVLIENFPIQTAMQALPSTLVIEDLHCRQRSHYPATLVIVPGESMRLELSWEADRMSIEEAQSILEDMQNMLECLGLEGDATFAQRGILGHRDTVSPKALHSQPRASAYANATIHECFERTARRQPDAVALIGTTRNLTYAELDAWANRLANALIEVGVAPESRVGLVAMRSFEVVAGLLAILKAGAAWVPLDPTYPAARLERMIEVSQPTVILSRSDITAAFAGDKLPIPVLSIDQYEAGAAQAAPVVALTPDSLAFVLFTSGSTGEPKGVMGTHRSTLAVAAWRETAFPYRKGEHCIHKTSLGFGDSIQEILGPLLAGASLAFLSTEGGRDPYHFVEEMLTYEVSRVIIVPSLLQAIFSSAARVERLVGTVLWIASGEALSAETIVLFNKRLPNARLVNVYGMSEASFDNTCADVVDAGVPALIGKPIAGAGISILDEHMRPVSVDTVGEIYVSGEVVNRGYFADPRKTASTFVPDPQGMGGRMFQTRDMGRFMTTQSIAYHGRIDQQVTLRGIRIEIPEVEAALAACPGVAQVAVVHDQDAQALVGWVVPDEREQLLKDGEYQVFENGLALFEYRRGETDYISVEFSEHDTPLPVLPDGAVVIDVGANIGMFSLAAHFAASDVHIVAVEPAPVVSSILRRNLILHGCSFELLQCAVGAQAGTADFTFYPNASLESGLYADVRKDEQIFRESISAEMAQHDVNRLMENRFDSERLEVRVVTLGDVIDQMGVSKVDLVKIDVERSEVQALQGLQAHHFERIARFTIEVECVDGAQTQATIAALFPPSFTLFWKPHGRLNKAGIWMLEAINLSWPVLENGLNQTVTFTPPTSSLSERLLRRQLADVLPAHMLPARIHFTDSLPQTPSGKLDRRALALKPAPVGAVVPATMDTVEFEIAQVWREVLRRQDIALDDNFFDIGGHSLLVLELLNRLEKRGHGNLSVADFYMCPTIAALADFLRQGRSERAATTRGMSRGEQRRLRARIRSENPHVQS
ncbi:amino acid adenylation domain-containing protein [Pseudomonas khavaziana]|uniref:Amino acid adenylation domain-containing protein n=1 Tax=Pseudomonas khavaziana TaxID=2842351 RepID=A0ABZ2DCS4_9PSED